MLCCQITMTGKRLETMLIVIYVNYEVWTIIRVTKFLKTMNFFFLVLLDVDLRRWGCITSFCHISGVLKNDLNTIWVEFLFGSLWQWQPGDSASMGYCLLLNVGLGEEVALSMLNELSGEKEEGISYIPCIFHHFHSVWISYNRKLWSS